MSILKGVANAGQGGKLGHSNMDHWEFTEEIKLAARKRRRLEAKRQVREALMELADKDTSELLSADHADNSSPGFD